MPTLLPISTTPLWARLALAVAFVTAIGCKVDANDFKHSMVLEKPWKPDASAPEGSGPEETRLYQLLYAGEYGDEAHLMGQKVRMATWLRTVDLTDAQLTTLTELGVEVQAAARADRASRAALAAQEAEVLAPIYARLEVALLNPKTTAEQLDRLAVELAEARATLYDEAKPHAEHRDRVRALIKASMLWLSQTSNEQRFQLNSCRFVLTEHASPLTNPGSYASLVGMIWDRGDFSALQMGDELDADGPIDLGGLWALEHLRAPPSGYMVESARAGMLLLALMDPAFLPVAEAALTTRGLPIPTTATTGDDPHEMATAP